MSTAQFESIFHGLGPTPGKLRIAPSGLGWKSSDERESVITVPSSDIKWIQWIRVARNFQLRIGTPKNRITFDGFLKDDFERLGNLCKQYYNTTIETTDTSVRGWNWGVAEIQAQDMAFLVAGKQAFTLPLANVSNTSINKAEVALEFTSALAPKPGQEENEDAVARKKRLKALPDEVAEMRFYLPGSAKGMKKKTDKIKAEGAHDGRKGTDVDDDDDDDDEEDDDDDDDVNGEEATAAQAFHDAVKEKADLGKITGESFCTIPETLCLTPRGRFDLDMHAEFLRLRGKTYDYRIAYTQIQKLFLLPKPDDIHCQFIVNIDPPIRQGQTRYPYLVMQFIKEEQLELDLNLDEETIKEKYNGNLKLHYDDPAYEVVSVLFRVMAQKKVTTPGSFQSHDGQQAVKCNLKANEGLLYPLEKQLLFISKQPSLVPHADISAVIFARVGGALPSARTFDLLIRLRGDPDHPIVFSALNKEELQPIEDFLRMKKIKIKNEMDEMAAVEAAVLGVDDSDEDQDDDDDEDGDVKMKKVKGGQGEEDDDEDDDDSPDEDFTIDSDDSDGGSATSDSESEMDSDAEAEESDTAVKAPAKKKQKTG
ncbi:BQ2448_324 [Microbotryum intermedium]|uniref:FACT complex subunit POB3 n=1 Tax=Microbotryum intermedium TaxID=269621 RepID=A0A238F853_9BASI|nr:BQ2448_324 [Microbotryum intermedium]